MKKSKRKNKKSWWLNGKFLCIAIAGTLFFGCEGFDGITAILGLTSLPTLVIFLVGLAFAGISIMVFFYFDLVEISKALGVEIKQAPKALDNFIDALASIKERRLSLEKEYIDLENHNEVRFKIEMLQALRDEHQKLNKTRLSLINALNKPKIKVAKWITAALAGIMFFSSGFFAGQAVATVFAGLFLASVAPTFWPIILASVLVGIAAFVVYWYFEKPSVENLISRCVGLDQEKMDEVCDEASFNKEQEKLTALEKAMERKYQDRLIIHQQNLSCHHRRAEGAFRYQNEISGARGHAAGSRRHDFFGDCDKSYDGVYRRPSRVKSASDLRDAQAVSNERDGHFSFGLQ